MAGKPTLHYFDGSGRMESIWWLLAAVGVEFEEKFLKMQEELEKLRKDGSLMFQQVPMVETDSMKLVQTRAISNYIATKHNLFGKGVKERALIDMYSEGVEICMKYLPPGDKDGSFTQIKDKSRHRYFPAFEKVLKESRTSLPCWQQVRKANINLTELLYLTEELDPSVLANFPLLKALRARISKLPTVKKLLQPGSQRKP
ncbi:Glutathione S-transferase alpha-3 [Sciurus carolinensis]|uniref:glutathione transferase n=1 Tax=Sciurus carolinensis TaxID=30640 RepID=A0AA41NFZ8_SCICA|nr:glutathione S-transferase alpha-3-like [Sciurus carolinensis]MBZ3889675.1 Glutathione S-transferase alpha-3 [Sciurus carolinensis]